MTAFTPDPNSFAVFLTTLVMVMWVAGAAWSWRQTRRARTTSSHTVSRRRTA